MFCAVRKHGSDVKRQISSGTGCVQRLCGRVYLAVPCRAEAAKAAYTLLIVGNHDSSWMGNVNLNRYFLSVDSFLEVSDGKHALTLCHYPLFTWKHEMRSYMVHGHIHANTSSDYFPLLCARERVLNAGVDINGFMPVTLDELKENNQRFKAEYKKEQ